MTGYKAIIERSWTARRAGGYITIQHSAGKITSIQTIEFATPTDTMLTATASNGDKYALRLRNE